MVAYSFKRRFVVPIKVGLGLPILPGDEDPEAATMLRPKRQTIRAIGLRRHARQGDTLQLYCGMRIAGVLPHRHHTVQLGAVDQHSNLQRRRHAVPNRAAAAERCEG